MMRMSKATKLLILLLLMLPITVCAQSPMLGFEPEPELDPRLELLMVLPEDIENGVLPWEREVLSLQRYERPEMLPLPLAFTYARQVFGKGVPAEEGVQPPIVTLRYGVFDELAALSEGKALLMSNLSSNFLEQDEPELYQALFPEGSVDTVQGRFPHHLTLRKDRVVYNIMISYQGSDDLLRKEEVMSDFMAEMVGIALQKMSQVSTEPVTPLDVEFEVVGEVPPITGAVRYGDATDAPIQVHFDVRDSEGNVVLTRTDLNDATDRVFGDLTNLFIQPGEEVMAMVEPGILGPGYYKLRLGVAGPIDRFEEFTHEFTVPDPSAPPVDPTSDTLSAMQDTTIYDRGPHKNEGANPRLLLKKVQGKPAHFLVGFDTASVNTNGLTKATLVLTIDPSQNVTGWGNGRAIRARRVLSEWAEGNGKSLELPGSQQTNGSGAGATWFSPVDTNIANSQADSAVTWSGGISFTVPSTAPTVTIKNHQQGEVFFDVTEDLLLGAPHGWLITRDQDVGSQVSFHSREAGGELGPQLLLEYGPGLARNAGGGPLELMHAFRTRPLVTTGYLAREVAQRAEGVLAYVGTEPGAFDTARGSLASALLVPHENPEAAKSRTVGVRQNTARSWAGERLAGALAGPNPVLSALGAFTYRAALEMV